VGGVWNTGTATSVPVRKAHPTDVEIVTEKM
jgi:hypothetical protein